MKRTFFYCVIAALFSTVGPSVVRADEDQGLGEKLFEADLIRIADLGSTEQLGPLFGPNGTDPLEAGLVTVRRKRQIEIQIQGAVPSVTYQAFFCRFGYPPAGCVGLGLVQTDREGSGEARLPFPAPQQAWAGVFVLTRNASVTTYYEFVSGFRFPAVEAQPGGVELDLRGTVASLNVANGSFRLGKLPLDIFVGPATRFDRIAGLAALHVGDQVQVTGFIRADGTIFATRVRSEEKGDEGGHGPHSGDR
jgi:hypothetical protein